MANALRMEINVIAIFILILLLFSNNRKERSLLDERLFYDLLVLTCVYSVYDTVSWMIDGVQGEQMHTLVEILNIICYLFSVFVPYIWIMYCDSRLFQDEKRLRKWNMVLLPPMIIYAIMVISTPYTGWMFSFDANNVYQRGPFYVVQIIMTSIYTILPTFSAYERLKTATMKAERHECYVFGLFVLIPMCGLIVQSLFYGIPAGIIGAAGAELMVFINIQNRQISLDSLTHINNRGQLNRYISAQVKKEYTKTKLYMLIMDIDFFKSINDLYGHRIGDQAIIDTASILQKACGKNGGFLARYGGDEFAIIIEKESDEQVDKLVTDIHTMIQQFNQNAGREYQLALSVGYAKYGTEKTPNADKWLEEADEQMYLMKEKKHREHANPNMKKR